MLHNSSFISSGAVPWHQCGVIYGGGYLITNSCKLCISFRAEVIMLLNRSPCASEGKIIVSSVPELSDVLSPYKL